MTDEILDTPEDLPSTDNSDTQDSQEESVIHQYLQATLAKIKNQIKAHKQPDCYINGDFFIRPKHAVFALHDATVHGLQPNHLCYRDVFVWLPQCLPGAPSSFKCTCDKKLSKNGKFKYNTVTYKPISFIQVGITNQLHAESRVYQQITFSSLIALYVILAVVMILAVVEVGRELILTSLLSFHVGFQLHFQVCSEVNFSYLLLNLLSFIAYISACGAIDKGLMSQMCNTFATRFGPSPFAEMMSEIQRKHHGELELMYFHAAQHRNLYGDKQIPAFSSFEDSLHYAGSPPSTQYLKAIFVDWLTAHRIFIQRAQACLPADVMKVDHTFDVSQVCYFYK